MRGASPLPCSSSAATEETPCSCPDEGGRYKSDFSPQPMFRGILNQHSIRDEWREAVCAKSWHEAMKRRDSTVSMTDPILSVKSLTEQRVPEIEKINCFERKNCIGKAQRNSPPSTKRYRLLDNAVLSNTRKKTSKLSEFEYCKAAVATQ